jgi:hypothetical protein
MRTVTKFVVAAAIVAGMTSTASAQQMSGGGFFKAPVLLAQPGVVTVGAVSCEDCESASGFNVRFTMVVPTSTPWFNLVMGTQFQPNGIGGDKNNTPGFYYGAIIPVAILGSMTQGWLSASIDPLGVYGPTATGDRPYAHELFLEAAFVLNVGTKMMQNMGPWSGLGVYFLIDQQLTHLPEDANGDTDRFNPVLLYGVTLPIAPWGR